MKYYFLALGTIIVVCVGCTTPGGQLLERGKYTAPPAAMMQRPGPMVDGPGPGVLTMFQPPQPAFSAKTSAIRFMNPIGMEVGWAVQGGFADNQVVTPGRYNFRQGATYRLKLDKIPDRPGLVLYPTLQIYPSHPSTDAYLSHCSIPLELTDEDLDQVESNNFVTKVLYLPEARYQDLAIAGVETIVSTKLNPGVDPVHEADRRGTIMAVLRVGNMDFETPSAGPMGVLGAPQQNPGAMPAPGMMPAVPGAMPANPAGPSLMPALPEDGQAAASAEGGIQQTQYQAQANAQAQAANPQQRQFLPPMPISTMGGGSGMLGVPNPMIVGGPTPPGQPPMHPVAGMGTIPPWGMTTTATPIGLPGPAHLPLGGAAGLRSHTIRNSTKVDIGEPVPHMLIDVKHKPGYRLPKPVRRIQYEETHPQYDNGEASWGRWQQ